MDMFNEKIETHVDNPKGNLLSNMSQEVKSILSAIFRDDYGGERTEKTTENMPIDVKGEMTQLFSDDYTGTNNSDVSTESVDLTKQYESNSKFKVDGCTYETDDRGYIYKKNGYELIPGCEYKIEGVTYNTDNKGRIVSCDGSATSTPEGERDNRAQTMAGGEDRREGDQGGHILARIFGGAKGIENMLAMRGSAINQSVYKRMENEIGKALEEGKDVHVHTDVEYEGESKRPSKITVRYTIDGKETVAQFDNDEGSTDLLESVMDKIDKEEYNDLKQEIEEANEDGCKISIVSVKTEYDIRVRVSKVIVTIRDENSEHAVNEDRVFDSREVS